MIPVIFWSNHAEVSAAEQWDAGLLRLMFEGKVWHSDFEFVISWQELHPLIGEHWGDTVVLVVPARHHASKADVEALNSDMAQFRSVLLMLIGDEEAEFPWRDVQHPNIKFWVMHPDPVKHADMSEWAYFFGTGFRYDTPAMLAAAGDKMPSKDVPWCFAGQVTHPRRKQCANALREWKTEVSGVLVETEGFTQGLPRQQYLELLNDTRNAMCPSGPATADTFRFYEALEAGCLPIVDVGPNLGESTGLYWDFVYGKWPGPVVGQWSTHALRELGAADDRVLATASAWWQGIKWGMADRLERDLQQLGVARPPEAERLTVIVTTSPIPSHPSMEILEETLDSIWRQLGGQIQIIIACDGVRLEQATMSADYYEYVRNICWHAEHRWENVLPVVADHHLHQAGLTRLALKYVDTPVILFIEHDTNFRPDPIDWGRCTDLLVYGSLDVLRFSHEAAVHPEHEHLMIDHQTIGMAGVPLRRTVQWSQRPHLARTAYYREILDRFFPPHGSAFIEDKMYSVVQSDYTMQHRIAVYHPAGSICRSGHLDGRAGGPKYDASQVF